MNLRRTTIIAALLVLALYGGLIISLGWFLKLSTLREALTSVRTLFSIQISLIGATVAAFLAILLAVPAAYALSRYRFRGQGVLRALSGVASGLVFVLASAAALEISAPAGTKLMSLVPIGHPVEIPQPEKRPLADVLHWEQF